jgi:NitT/TauT family transport system ATP-binding protein
VVLSSHPGRLKRIVDIDLPRPRGDATRKSAAFADLSQSIWELIRDEAYRATMN